MPNSMKYRRRQAFLGVFVLILSVFTVAQSVYFRAQDTAQRNCMGEAFSELSQLLTLRSRVNDRTIRNTDRIIAEAFRANSKAEAQRAYRRYEREVDAIQRTREENPVPGYPQGTCNG